jgi:glycosyltransferase involved in cell wall biosynthesis
MLLLKKPSNDAPKPIRVLLEMRPALDGHAGIPQQVRLLFRGLSLIDEFAIAGLVQSSTHALGKGLPPEGRTWLGTLSADRQVNRLARIIIMLEQQFLRSYLSVVPLTARSLLGASEQLTRFEPRQFRDFIWRRLFSASLPAIDFTTVTRCGFRVAQAPWTAMHLCGLVTGYRLYPRLNTREFDVMIAETPYPATVAKHTRLVIRYHDAIPLLMPDTISGRRHHQAMHYRALRRNVESGAWFACVSESTRKDLLGIFPQAERRSVTIHNMVSHEYFDEPAAPERVPEIVKARLHPSVRRALSTSRSRTQFDVGSLTRPPEYLLVVSTIEPRKNHLTLLSAWQVLRADFPDLKLLVVGALGWHQAAIFRKFLPWIERGEVYMLKDVPAPELRALYKSARATICPSFAEGFDLSGVEAMRSGGAVVASDLAVHREIYENAAEFFNPYSVDELVHAIRNVINPAQAMRREELVELGATVAQRYTCDTILPKWQEFLATRPLASV